MKSVFRFIGSAAVALAAASVVSLTGCSSNEQEPMPPGAFIPSHSTEPEKVPEKQETAVKPAEQEPDDNPFSIQEGETDKKDSVKEKKETVKKETAKKDTKKDAKKTAEPVKAGHSAAEQIYIVKKGDKLSKIANMYDVSEKKLADYNKIANPNKIIVGSKIKIPAGAKELKNESANVKTASAASKKTAAPRQARKAAPVPADGIHVVKKGESLWLIARKYGIHSQDLAAANNIQVNKVLRVGEKLKIPSKSATAAKTSAKPGVKSAAKTSNAPAKKQAKASAAPAASATAAPAAAPAAAAPKANEGSEQDIMDEIKAPEIPAGTNVNAPEVPASPAEPAPAPAPVPASAKTHTLQTDMSLEDFAGGYQMNIKELRMLNPTLKEGVQPAGTVINLP